MLILQAKKHPDPTYGYREHVTIKVIDNGHINPENGCCEQTIFMIGDERVISEFNCQLVKERATEARMAADFARLESAGIDTESIVFP